MLLILNRTDSIVFRSTLVFSHCISKAIIRLINVMFCCQVIISVIHLLKRNICALWIWMKFWLIFYYVVAFCWCSFAYLSVMLYCYNWTKKTLKYNSWLIFYGNNTWITNKHNRIEEHDENHSKMSKIFLNICQDMYWVQNWCVPLNCLPLNYYHQGQQQWNR